MHLQLIHVPSGKSIKRYARLVQSHQRPDGKPAYRVIANLGTLSDVEVENFRTSLRASRLGKAVVLPETPTRQASVLANLTYLDVGAALDVWRSWSLSELLSELIVERDVAMRSADVVCALTIQRCIASTFGGRSKQHRYIHRRSLGCERLRSVTAPTSRPARATSTRA